MSSTEETKAEVRDPETDTEIKRAWKKTEPLTADQAIERSRAAMNRIFRESLRERDRLGF